VFSVSAAYVATENEEDDVDFDEGKKEGRRRRGGTGSDRDRSLPPLLARVNGQIEVSQSVNHTTSVVGLR